MKAPVSRLLLRVLPVVFCLISGLGSSAQQFSLRHFEPVLGRLDAAEQHNWSFIATSGSLLSLVARTVAGDLDPRLDLYGVDGALIASSDDVDWPVSTDAVIEALTPGQTGRYSVRISSVGQGSGDYELTLLQGWSSLHWSADFANVDAWKASTTAAESYLSDGRAVLILEPPVESLVITRALEMPRPPWGLHADITEVAGNRGWRVGIITGWQGALEWSRFSVDNQGRWQFLVRDADDVRVLRERAPHPAIGEGEKPTSIGLVHYGDAIEFFYNRRSLGRLVEGIPEGSGDVGLYAGSGSAGGGQVTAWFSNLRLTLPAEITAGVVLPDRLPGEERPAILRQLQRRRLVPAVGQLDLNVAESYVISNRAGVSTLRLGGQRQFSRFALGTSFELNPGSWELAAGCGLVLEKEGEETYTLAWLDHTGSAGLSRREGDSFAPGPVRSDLNYDEGPHQLLVVANGEKLYFYADRQLVGQQPVSRPDGTIGNAALSFGNVSSNCRFRDTWLWSWEAS